MKKENKKMRTGDIKVEPRRAIEDNLNDEHCGAHEG
jgi:hypothetical protein